MKSQNRFSLFFGLNGMRIFGLLALCLLLPASLFAAQMTGTVIDGTTNKPSAGDQVVVMSLAQGMEEVGSGTTDAQGKFSIKIPDDAVQHLVRVVHQGVNYHKSVAAGVNTADLTIYDAARQIDNLIAEGHVFRVLSADSQQIQVSELYVLRNESNPPRTKAGDRTLEIVLPEGAQIQDGMAAGPGGLPTNTSPVATGKKNHYAFAFPFRPGKSQLQITYTVPYSGSQQFSVTPDMPLAELGIMLPKTMRFSSPGEAFSPAADEAGMTVYVAKSVPKGQQLKFSLAGQGVAPSEDQAAAAQPASTAAPGGGLGTPNNAPDPLSGSRWYIIIGMVAVLAAGAYFLLLRKPRQAPAAAAPTPAPARPQPKTRGQQKAASPSPQVSAGSNGHGGVIEALKEELFQLESDRVQGKISPEEYEASRRGIETLMKRQMSRSAK
ncbi:MAG TPA: hypothetical protein VFI72_05635 [Candidatus Angelobacter sp.]|nr:hypothetical protein [Candidatus Angelobacter sp.]